MVSKDNKPGILSSLRGLLGRRDWVYVLSLLVPFVIYSLVLKALMLASRNVESVGQYKTSTIGLLVYGMWSDIFFVLGYALLWIGLLAVARRGLLRWVVLVLFHVTTILVVALKTIAYQYILTTGTTLDYTVIVLWLPRYDEVGPLVAGGTPTSAWVLLVAALLYAALGPYLVTRLVARWRGWPGRSSERPQRLPVFSALVLGVLAFGFGALSLQEGFNPYYEYLQLTGGESGAVTHIGKPLVRDPLANVAITASQEFQRGAQDASYPAADVSPASLSPTTGSADQQRNVVVVLLESTRAKSVPPYENLDTMPFLNELSKHSLLAERAYGSVPFTSKANVAVNCGIPSLPVQVAYGLTPEAGPGGIPTKCLPGLLKDQGYSSAYFMTSDKTFENFGGLIDNFGYDEFYSREYMDMQDLANFRNSGLSGDEIMLKPSEEWLTQQKDAGKPFMATYLTAVTHYPYSVPDTYQQENYTNDPDLNRYLNAIRLEDTFLQELFDQYKKLGLYDNTVFVVVADHGEGFGEHGIYEHGNIPYEEGLKIPMLIHDPQRYQDGARVTQPVSQLDILPTVTDLLGYKIQGGEFQGNSLLGSLPEDRPLNFSCWGAEQCLASLQGTEKYIYWYDNRPDQLFDLANDPNEQQDLASEYPEEVQKRRDEILAWRSKVDAIYRGPQGG